MEIGRVSGVSYENFPIDAGKDEKVSRGDNRGL